MLSSICPECQGKMEWWPPYCLKYEWKKCRICAFMKKQEKFGMITMKELNPNSLPMTDEIEANINNLLTIMNKVRQAYAIPMKVTSGLRDIAKQEAIYAQKNKLRAEQFLPPIPTPLGSQHLYGNAVDIEDKDGRLRDWVISNMSLMESLGLYFEDFNSTEGWIHFQQVAPRSGKRIFIP